MNIDVHSRLINNSQTIKTAQYSNSCRMDKGVVTYIDIYLEW